MRTSVNPVKRKVIFELLALRSPVSVNIKKINPF